MLIAIDCGVAKTDIISLEGVRFAGNTDLTTGREMGCKNFHPVAGVHFASAMISPLYNRSTVLEIQFGEMS